MPAYNGSTFHSGFLGTALVNATGLSYTVTAGQPVLTASTISGGSELPLISWGNGPAATIVPIMNSKTGGQPLKEATYSDDTNITLLADIDFAMNPYISANGGLVAGATIPWVLLFLNQTKKSGLDGKYWAYSSVVIQTTPVRVAIAGQIGLQFTAQSSGPWWPPQS